MARPTCCGAGQVARGGFARGVEAYRAETPKDWLAAGFGLWPRHGVEIDPIEWDRKRRAEWTRQWDDDYEEVRAESPDMFDEYDDKERRIYLDMVARKCPELIVNEASDK